VTTSRLARIEEAAALVALEIEAARVYLALEGYHWVNEAPPMAVEEVERAIAEDGVWVVERHKQVVGAAVCLWHEDDCHLRELNVHPQHARRGLGRGLVDAVIDGARRRGCSRVVLTTFSHVPFNGPWYERLGFSVLRHPTGWLAEERAEEARIGLDRRRRQAMAKRLR